MNMFAENEIMDFEASLDAMFPEFHLLRDAWRSVVDAAVGVVKRCVWKSPISAEVQNAPVYGASCYHSGVFKEQATCGADINNGKEKTMNINDIKAGYVFTAIVKLVRDEGVYVEMPVGKGSALVSTRCWGKGTQRAKALAKVKPGDKLEVVVRSYNLDNCTRSLVLAGYKQPMPAAKKAQKAAKKPCKVARKERVAARPVFREPQRAVQRKPDFRPIAAGTLFLVDVANLLSITGVEHAAQILDGMSSAMTAMGYKSIFFIERRSLTWARYNQTAESEAGALMSFFDRGDAVVVEDGGRSGGSEADCAMLQMAEAVQDSVCVTQDHFSDYAKAHPAIVGSDRVRSFSVAKFEGKTIILVDGLVRPLVVEFTDLEENKCGAAQATTEATAPKVREAVQAKPVVYREKEYSRTAEQLLSRGEAERAIRYLGMVAKSDPGAYCALADVYRDGKAVPVDNKKAIRYERLARKAEKRARERDLRDRRRRAESARSGCAYYGHFSAKRRDALRVALFTEGHEAIRDYFKGVSRRARRTFGHAA